MNGRTGAKSLTNPHTHIKALAWGDWPEPELRSPAGPAAGLGHEGVPPAGMAAKALSCLRHGMGAVRVSGVGGGGQRKVSRAGSEEQKAVRKNWCLLAGSLHLPLTAFPQHPWERKGCLPST